MEVDRILIIYVYFTKGNFVFVLRRNYSIQRVHANDIIILINWYFDQW